MTVKDPIADLLTPKHYIRVGCWNVRTLYQTEKLAQAVNEMKNWDDNNIRDHPSKKLVMTWSRPAYIPQLTAQGRPKMDTPGKKE